MCHQFFERMQRAIGIQEILADKYYYFEKTKKNVGPMYYAMTVQSMSTPRPSSTHFDVSPEL